LRQWLRHSPAPLPSAVRCTPLQPHFAGSTTPPAACYRSLHALGNRLRGIV